MDKLKSLFSKMNSPKPKVENTKIDQATMDALKMASDKSKMELLRTENPESPKKVKAGTRKRKAENFVVPSAESLESFERLVARRRESWSS